MAQTTKAVVIWEVVLFVSCISCALASSNDGFSMFFPTNLVLGMAKEEVQTNRPAAIDSLVGMAGTNSRSSKMLEPAVLFGSRGMYWYHFYDGRLRAITSSAMTNVGASVLTSQVVAQGYSYVSATSALRWDGKSTNLTEIPVDVWQWTNHDVLLCSCVFSNESTLILYDRKVFSPSNFFTSISQRQSMESIIKKFGQQK